MNLDHLSRELLSALVDGECGPDERRHAHEHVQRCSECRLVLADLTAVRDLVERLPPLEAPAELMAAVLHPRGRLRAVVGGRRKYLVAAAAAALTISLAGVAAPPVDDQPPIDALVTRHVSVNAGNQTSGEVLFAVTGR